ncbi:MAG: 1,4-dihydroxy-2-naphthoate polyprenyltransferase [Micrococcales bacterium]
MANTKKARKRRIALWVEGARLRTLPLAVAPVAAGVGAAASVQGSKPLLAVLALFVALFLQIGVNFSNDYSDGIRGTDAKRVGPLRLTGSGSIKPKQVKLAAFIFFGLAALTGLAIVLITGFWWLVAVGVVAILAAWFYTGGAKPYGYAALGDLAVFIFFGVVATVGTSYIQLGYFDNNSIVASIATGSFASAVLMVNNIRDIDLDRHVGKKTLAVLVGKKIAKAIFIFEIWLPIAILVFFALSYPATFFALAAVLLVAPATLIVLTAKTPKELILVLKITSMAALIFGLLLGYGLSIVAV